MHIQVLNKRKGPMTQSKIPQGTIHQMRGGGGGCDYLACHTT
jgi:hypothetical protein